MQIPIGLETLLVAEKAALNDIFKVIEVEDCEFVPVHQHLMCCLTMYLILLHTESISNILEMLSVATNSSNHRGKSSFAGMPPFGFLNITWMPSLIQVGHCNLAGCSQPGVSQLRPSIAAQPHQLSEASSQCRAPNLRAALNSIMLHAIINSLYWHCLCIICPLLSSRSLKVPESWKV